MFRDRDQAGRRLSEAVEGLRGQAVVVLGLPRGGVPVAAEVAMIADVDPGLRRSLDRHRHHHPGRVSDSGDWNGSLWSLGFLEAKGTAERLGWIMADPQLTGSAGMRAARDVLGASL